MTSHRRQKPGDPDGASPRRRRCAIYTRKSSEEGLDQSFNSLHAQRDACEAFVASQKHEGWVLVPTAYDDGGLSGGSLERPALRQLLADVEAGRIDIVVVYKVDRLTRSLADFAKLTELFDQHGTSFVSVTQQFNTSTSMGRLTLNVLLSFAQFEREVAGERIRDKIALSKQRGMWMGGLPPLGYDAVDRGLVVNEAEAETVQLIFRRYAEVGSIAALKDSLDRDGIVSKLRRFANGGTRGGVSFSRGALYQILRNRLYRGEIAHRGQVHKGNHDAIVDRELWDQTQEQLEGQSARRRGGRQPSESGALLAGLVFDGDGNRLTPSYAVKSGRRYRYYVSAPLTRGANTANPIRVPASDLEEKVFATIDQHLRDPHWVSSLFAVPVDADALEKIITAGNRLAEGWNGETPDKAQYQPLGYATDRRPAGFGDEVQPVASHRAGSSREDLIEKIVVTKRRLLITLNPFTLGTALIGEVDSDAATHRPASSEMVGTGSLDGASDHRPLFKEPIELSVNAHLLRCGRQVRLVVGEVTADQRAPDPEMIRLISDAARWFHDLVNGRAKTLAEIAAREDQQISHVSRTIGLAFLAPDIVRMIVAGRQPPHVTIDRLRPRQQPLPSEWSNQRRSLRVPSPAEGRCHPSDL